MNLVDLKEKRPTDNRPTVEGGWGEAADFQKKNLKNLSTFFRSTKLIF